MRDVPQADRVRTDLDPSVVLAAHARQRRRFAATVATLDADALAARSRCTEWSVADVMRHIVDVDGWMLAMWAGDPPPFSDFDPRVTPHDFVVAGRMRSDAEARDRFIASSEAMADDISSSGPERWGAFGISPLGVVPWWMSVLHIFWDSWLHERDASLPHGLDVSVESDEVTATLAYSLVLVGNLLPEPIDVTVDGVRLKAGKAVEVTVAGAVPSGNAPRIADALCGRGDLDAELLGGDAALAHTLGELSRRFQPNG